jgi:hypothetical protein
VYRSTQLAVVQDTVALLDRLVWILPLVTIVLAAAAMYLAPSRSRMGGILLAAAALGWLLAWIAVQLVVDRVVSGIDSQAGAVVAAEIFNGVTSGLSALLLTLVIVGGLASSGVFAWNWYSGRAVGTTAEN